MTLLQMKKILIYEEHDCNSFKSHMLTRNTTNSQSLQLVVLPLRQYPQLPWGAFVIWKEKKKNQCNNFIQCWVSATYFIAKILVPSLRGFNRILSVTFWSIWSEYNIFSKVYLAQKRFEYVQAISFYIVVLLRSYLN